MIKRTDPLVWFYFIVFAFVLAGMWASVAFAAEYMGEDYPYHIYKDGNDLYYCMEWDEEERTACYMRGKKFSCDTRKLEINELDCRPESWG